MPEFIINKDGGVFKNVKKMEEFNKSLPDGKYLVKIVPYKQRSLLQNAWFHAVLPEIMQGLRDAGYDEVKSEEDAKDVVKGMFFKKKISNGIEEIEIIQHTSKTSKINFAERSDEIIKWAAEYLNLDIAPPETQLELKQLND